MLKPEKKTYVTFLCVSLASKLNKTVSDSNYIKNLKKIFMLSFYVSF